MSNMKLYKICLLLMTTLALAATQGEAIDKSTTSEYQTSQDLHQQQHQQHLSDHQIPLAVSQIQKELSPANKTNSNPSRTGEQHPIAHDQFDAFLRTPSLFARILRPSVSGISTGGNFTSMNVNATNSTGKANSNIALTKSVVSANGVNNQLDDQDADDEDDDEDDDVEEDDDDDDDDGDDEQTKANSTVTTTTSTTTTEAPSKSKKGSNGKILTDLFGNKIKLENNRTILLSQNKARDLGMLTIKALLLGPLIGLTLKAALIRGLLYAVGAYFMHLFFPALLGTLGLGTGLVGFARQVQPDYTQMFAPHLINLQNAVPSSFRKLISQYTQMFEPVVDSIRSIPEGHCRFRAVCETASYMIRNSQSLSSTLQRISATVYLNFGTEYSKAWLDGIVQGDCAAKYSQCAMSPLSMVATRLADSLRLRVAPVN